MKIVDAHYTFDRSRMVVTFGAEGRVDFRPLIHALISATGGRVELRQLGDRDIAKLTGGIGHCGNELCCVKWIDKFKSISVHMAKEQSLPISAEGLTGACGRLPCCLRFEYEQYRQVNKLLPKIGELMGTPSGSATVIVGRRMKKQYRSAATMTGCWNYPWQTLPRTHLHATKSLLVGPVSDGPGDIELPFFQDHPIL